MKRRQKSAQPEILPLRDAELAELQSVLEAGEGMTSVHEVHGAFAALATAPQLVSPNAWLRIVLGEQPPLVDMAHAQRVLDLLMRAYNFVLDELAHARSVAPGLDASDEDAAAWCRGYLEIAEADEEWHADEEGDGLLMPIAIVAGEFSLIGEVDDDGKVIEDDTPQRVASRAALDTIVMEQYAYWTARRRATATATTKSPGRNEACPCGSGKKYKRCCGVVH